MPRYRNGESKLEDMYVYELFEFTRSLLALLLRLAQDKHFDIATLKSLVAMLEASGYDLQKDVLCWHLKDMAKRIAAVRKPPCDMSGSKTSVGQVAGDQLNLTLHFFHWAGVVAPAPSEELVEYINEVIKKLVCPAVPGLASMCRLRIRQRVTETQRGNTLKQCVEQLPVPHLMKRYLMLEDFD
ncbi:hypothetical protein ElyMa_000768200 [Elysia marginata]|uniref:SOCS box domain-containing protein n=1 Tax=Elysia marginata TaxID=1093978 RepID=A0AAV4GRF8_9GAST|nr:hypothetical protein ElyMa_000768200 [Elysia marginata]